MAEDRAYLCMVSVPSSLSLVGARGESPVGRPPSPLGSYAFVGEASPDPAAGASPPAAGASLAAVATLAGAAIGCSALPARMQAASHGLVAVALAVAECRCRP